MSQHLEPRFIRHLDLEQSRLSVGPTIDERPQADRYWKRAVAMPMPIWPQRPIYQTKYLYTQSSFVEDVLSTPSLQLFKFPQEIRDIIYEFALTPEGGQIWLPMLGGCPPSKSRNCLRFYDMALLRTSKTVYGEAQQVLYNKVLFRLTVRRWDCPRSLKVLPRIKCLFIEFERIEEWIQLLDYIIKELNLRTLKIFSPSRLFPRTNLDTSLDRLHNAFRITKISPYESQAPQWFPCSTCESNSLSRSDITVLTPLEHPIDWRSISRKPGHNVHSISFHDQINRTLRDESAVIFQK